MRKCVNEYCQFFIEHGECSEVCTNQGIAKIVTNADKIRDMSDEELADFLVTVETHGYHDQSISGTLEMIDWLKNEVN